MTLDNMTGITRGSYTGADMFCKSQLITCNRVKECNGVCPFEDALKHADKRQTMNEQHIIDHDKDWIIGCLKHDGFIHTQRFDKANQIILHALSSEADRPTGKWEIKTETDEYGLKRPKLVCSKCEKEPAAWDLTELFEFCPNCGSRNVREDGDTE